MALRVHGRVPERRIAELEAWVAGQRITEQVVRETDRAGLVLAEVVEMDEYTLDLFVPLPDGLVLVYDTT